MQDCVASFTNKQATLENIDATVWVVWAISAVRANLSNDRKYPIIFGDFFMFSWTKKIQLPNF